MVCILLMFCISVLCVGDGSYAYTYLIVTDAHSQPCNTNHRDVDGFNSPLSLNHSQYIPLFLHECGVEVYLCIRYHYQLWEAYVGYPSVESHGVEDQSEPLSLTLDTVGCRILTEIAICCCRHYLYLDELLHQDINPSAAQPAFPCHKASSPVDLHRHGGYIDCNHPVLDNI